MIKKPTRSAAVRADAAVYSGEALKLAAFVFSDKARIEIKGGRNFFEVAFSAEAPGFVPGDYFNEALNQQCRLDLAGKNAKAAGMIATKALLSAAGEDKPKKKKA